MKSKIYTNLVAYCYKIQLKIVLSILFICSLSSISFGQSMYICMGEDGNSVYAAAYVSIEYMSSSHTNTTYVQISGPSGTASGSGSTSASTEVAIADGTFTAYAFFDSICPFTGESAGAGSGTAQTTVCTDTCTPCQTLRDIKKSSCDTNLLTCEGAALAAYIAAFTTCENQTFCQSGNANYNEEECTRCKQGVSAAYAVAAGTCAAIYINCLGDRVDCTPSNYKTTQCSACANN